MLLVNKGEQDLEKGKSPVWQDDRVVRVARGWPHYRTVAEPHLGGLCLVGYKRTKEEGAKECTKKNERDVLKPFEEHPYNLISINRAHPCVLHLSLCVFCVLWGVSHSRLGGESGTSTPYSLCVFYCLVIASSEMDSKSKRLAGPCQLVSQWDS